MINKIKSIKGGVNISLDNDFSRYVYSIDSINLIIGNNGTGKTTLIKSIIKDLAGDGSPSEFIGEGVTERMGIIYYTAAPFHRIMKNISNNSVAFLDASAKIIQTGGFVHAAQEYIEIAQSLEIANDLKSVQIFDLRDAAFTLAYSLFGNLVQRGPISTDALLSESLKELKSLNLNYSRVKKHLQEHETTRGNESFYRDEDMIMSMSQYSEQLNEELEDIAKRIDRVRSEIATNFLRECRSNDVANVIDWIAAICILRDNPSPANVRVLAQRLQAGEQAQTKLSPFDRKLIRTREIVADFLSQIQRASAGEYFDTGDVIEIHVDTPVLLRARPKKTVIEEAHKKGLIRIGFDTISSGQAAILHQMINISSAARQLVAMGKKRLLVFIDEGDLLLHMQWQREYISLVDTRLSSLQRTLNLKSVQLVVASHSAILATDILRDSITRLGSGGATPSFAAPLQQIVNFSFGTPSIGMVAQRTVDSLRQKISLDEIDLAMVEQIDDSFVRDLLLKKGVR
jgi:hypothetical protein